MTFTAEDRKRADRVWPEGWTECNHPSHEGKTVLHSVRFHGGERRG